MNGKELTFGISGRLYKSNVLLYDHQSESLWSQLMSKAISGPKVNQVLDTIPSVRLSWKKWRRLHPDTQVLSERTGYERNYRIDPYEGYYSVGGLMFPVGAVRRDLATKERVLGIVVDGKAKAYALERLRQHTGILKDRIGRVAIAIEVSDAGEVVSVQDNFGQTLSHMYLYWFAWQAFYPHTTVHHF